MYMMAPSWKTSDKHFVRFPFRLRDIHSYVIADIFIQDSFFSGALLYIPFGVLRLQRQLKFVDSPMLFFEYLMDLGEPQVANDEPKTKDQKLQNQKWRDGFLSSIQRILKL